MKTSPQRSELRRAILAAGCRIRATTDSPDGPLFMVDCPGHEVKLRLLDELSWVDSRRDDVRRLAGAIRGSSATRLEAAVKAHELAKRIPYRDEKIETFVGPRVVMAIGGDCDDSARFLVALLRAMAMTARHATIHWPPDHVAAQLWTTDGWYWLDASLAADFGEHPLVARDRLGL